MDLVGCISIFVHLCNNNNQREREYQFENGGTGGFGKSGHWRSWRGKREGRNDVIIFSLKYKKIPKKKVYLKDLSSSEIRILIYNFKLKVC